MLEAISFSIDLNNDAAVSFSQRLQKLLDAARRENKSVAFIQEVARNAQQATFCMFVHNVDAKQGISGELEVPIRNFDEAMMKVIDAAAQNGRKIVALVEVSRTAQSIKYLAVNQAL